MAIVETVGAVHTHTHTHTHTQYNLIKDKKESIISALLSIYARDG